MHQPDLYVSRKRNRKSIYVVRVGKAWPREVRDASEVLALVERYTVNAREDERLPLAAESVALIEELRAAVSAPSWKQRERQWTRDRTGRYEVMNECQVCDKRIGAEYYSDNRTDTTDSAGNGWGDCALVLCARCCEGLGKLDDQAAFDVATHVTRAPWLRTKRSATNA